MYAACDVQVMAAPAPAPAPAPDFDRIQQEWDTVSQSSRHINDELSLLPPFLAQFNRQEDL